MTPEEKITAEFAKRGYAPARLKRFEHLLKTVQEFTQYVSVNQYHSDAFNKRIFRLNMEAEELLLEFELLMLIETELAETLKQKKVKFDKKAFEEFKKQVNELGERVKESKVEAVELIKKIKKDYASQ